MSKRSKPPQAPVVPEAPLATLIEHDHPLSEHNHPHEHPHAHPLEQHDHAVGQHEHPSLATLEHREVLAREIKNTQYSLRAEWRGAVRALLAVFEISNLNSEQRKAIHVVRVIIGDTHGSSCQHETTVYEEGDVLICQDCRQVIQ